MNIKAIITLSLVAFFCSCSILQTGPDSKDPVLLVYEHNQGTPKLISTTDSILLGTITGLGCPNSSIFSTSYVTGLIGNSHLLSVTSSDQGGVNALDIFLSPLREDQITTVTLLNDPQSSPIIRQSGPLEVTISAVFQSRRTAQTVQFLVAVADSVLTVDATTTDRSNNSTRLVDGVVNTYPLQIIDESVCEVYND